MTIRNALASSPLLQRSFALVFSTTTRSRPSRASRSTRSTTQTRLSMLPTACPSSSRSDTSAARPARRASWPSRSSLPLHLQQRSHSHRLHHCRRRQHQHQHQHRQKHQRPILQLQRLRRLQRQQQRGGLWPRRSSVSWCRVDTMRRGLCCCLRSTDKSQDSRHSQKSRALRVAKSLSQTFPSPSPPQTLCSPPLPPPSSPPPPPLRRPREGGTRASRLWTRDGVLLRLWAFLRTKD